MKNQDRAILAIVMLRRSERSFNQGQRADRRVLRRVGYIFAGGLWLLLASIVEATVKTEPPPP